MGLALSILVFASSTFLRSHSLFWATNPDLFIVFTTSRDSTTEWFQNQEPDHVDAPVGRFQAGLAWCPSLWTAYLVLFVEASTKDLHLFIAANTATSVDYFKRCWEGTSSIVGLLAF